MKNKSKILFLIATIISAFLFLFFSFKSYNSYKAYKISQSSDKYISFLYRGDNLLQKLEEERLLSAFYLGNNNEIDFEDVKNARHNTDEVLRNSKELLKIYPNFLKNLQYARSRVDIISDEHQDILFKYYQNELSDSVLKQILVHTQELSLGITEIKNELTLYEKLLTYKNKMNSKNSFITYILANSKKLNNNDLLTLDKMLNEIQAPIKLSPTNNNFKSKLAIVQGVNTGKFKIKPKDWITKYSSDLNTIKKAKKDIFYKIQSKLKKLVTTPQYLINDVVIALFFLISMLFLIKKVFQESENRLVIQKDRRKVNRDNDHNKEKYIVLKYDNNSNNITDAVDTKEIEFSKTAIRSFNPMQKFVNIVDILKTQTDKKDIGFKYKIDPDIPTSSIGNVSKIDEILNILIDHILTSSSSNNFLIFNAESIAQTKVENAIKISFTKSNTNTNNISKNDDLTLLKVKKLATLIDGTFKVKGGENETIFIVTINLKKGS
jgi:hypothetical protein